MKGLRYLDCHWLENVLPFLPADMEYLEVVLPICDETEESRNFGGKTVKVETLALMDRSFAESRSVDQKIGSPEETTGLRIFMAALTGIRRLVLRVDPEFHRLSLEHLDIRYFLATVGLHADEEGLVNLGDLVLEVDSSDDFRMVGCENILFVDNVSQWLEMKNREKKLPCLKRITIVFHLRRCTISWNDVEFVMGSPSSIADQVQEGYTFCSFAADIQDNFLPTIADIKKAFKRFQKPHRQIEELDVQVRLAPSEEDRDLLMDNPPFLHVHGKFRPDGTTDYLANSRTDAWEKSREGDMRIAFEEYKKISSEFQERLGELEMQVDEELLGDDGDYA